MKKYHSITLQRMGSGASLIRDALRPLLLSQELIEGSCRLAHEDIFRMSFTNYIKGGAWMDCLTRLVPETHCTYNNIIWKNNDHSACLLEYNVDHSRLSSLQSLSMRDKSPPPSFGIPVSSITSKTGGNDGYSCVGGTSCFSQEELLAILLTILYPIYLSSPAYERFIKYGIEKGNAAYDDNSSNLTRAGYQDTKLVQTKQSIRAQELLLACAAFHDESYLHEYLQETTWLQRVCNIFHDHSLALCFTDTAKAGLPIMFANAAFCRMFGYTEEELINSNLSILNGSCTEIPKLKLMHGSVRSTETVKFSITLQSKSKKPLFDLVAQKVVGSFSVSAHFVKSRASSLDALNMVDDVLILLSYLVKAPALPAKPSWLPAPIAILARSASNALHASPSSARSRSSSVGCGRVRTDSTSTNRLGKGTPTSLRSFGLGSALIGGSGSGRGQQSISCTGSTIMEVCSAGSALHVPADAEAAVEFSMCESTHKNTCDQRM